MNAPPDATGAAAAASAPPQASIGDALARAGLELTDLAAMLETLQTHMRPFM